MRSLNKNPKTKGWGHDTSIYLRSNGWKVGVGCMNSIDENLIMSKKTSSLAGSFARNQFIRGICSYEVEAQVIQGEVNLVSNKKHELELDVLINGEFNSQISTQNNSFQISLKNLPITRPLIINIQTSDQKIDIPGSPLTLPNNDINKSSEIHILKIDPYNIGSILERKEKIPSIEHLVIDTNDTCNANCVYCPNPRSSKLISTEEFELLVNDILGPVGIFQFGCGQEPTLDQRLPDLFEKLNNSGLCPRKICMITNATRINTTLLKKLCDSGLDELQVSIDTVDAQINNITRQNTDIESIKHALQEAASFFPDLKITFSTVINSLSIHTVQQLLDFGKSLDVKTYIFREVWDFLDKDEPTRHKDYKKWMSNLTLTPGEFLNLQSRLTNHPEYPKIQFFPALSQESAKESQLKTL